MHIKHWPSDERPRERLLSVGAENLSDAELLAIFLRTGVKGQSAVELSRSILQEFHDLRGLFLASKDEFCRVKGLGDASYVQFQAVLELSRRYFMSTIKRSDALLCSDAVKSYLMMELQDHKEEVFAALFLDCQNRPIKLEKLFFGSISGAAVYPRVIVRRTLQLNAASVIVTHNHPSGLPQPSKSDIAITKRISSALELIDVRLLDHIIIGDACSFSFLEEGLL